MIVEMKYGSQPMPEAYITRSKTKNRGRLKIYTNNTIYLENQEEFEIELYNPTNSTILAKIEINDNLISSSGLVLKPAQRVFLERYFDVDRKFKFDVYEVENWEKLKESAQNISEERNSIDEELSLRTQLLKIVGNDSERLELEKKIEVLKTKSFEMKSLEDELNKKGDSIKYATKNNGKIRVMFYRESTLLHRINYPSDYFVLNSSYNSINNISNDNNSLLTSISTYSTDTTNISYNNTETKETGRIEQGDISNQKFVNSYNIFDYMTFHAIEYLMLPISEKPMEVKDLRRYCNNCGKKLAYSDNFCSSCGNKI